MNEVSAAIVGCRGPQVGPTLITPSHPKISPQAKGLQVADGQVSSLTSESFASIYQGTAGDGFIHANIEKALSSETPVWCPAPFVQWVWRYILSPFRHRRGRGRGSTGLVSFRFASPMIQLKCPIAFCQHPSSNCLNRNCKGIRQHQMCKWTSHWSGSHKQSVCFFLISLSETYPPWTQNETKTEIKSYRMKDCLSLEVPGRGSTGVPDHDSESGSWMQPA
ncbi:hypothetical protein HNY73_012937 [Argiope bruennichi]|uniref:Uncharacterized protein n=1 Tax=Argiope bruennichi TaxID=94029 RepID=A0A8T0F188_ARGBR|nr:hypothetical protein HNY73_012937 [Argiope bruennichi]